MFFTYVQFSIVSFLCEKKNHEIKIYFSMYACSKRNARKL